MDLRIATCRVIPEPDADQELLLAALARRGVRGRMAGWDDDAEDWDAPVPTVIRSTWNYIHALDPFRRWIERAARAAPLWNPPDVVGGNLHKRYLIERERDGVPIVPTELIEREDPTTLADVVRRRGWSEIVVKPAVSAASFGTRRFQAHELESAEMFFADSVRRHDVLVQPYLRAVDDYGERALVWIDGEFTHAVRKSPRFSDGAEQVSPAVPIAADELALAQRVLDSIASPLLYARVDVAHDADGALCLMELELIEPSLFLRQSPRALERLADGLARRLT